ncbi:hypothetical protein GA0115245_15012 [Streptomyces sp. di188]|nr:hypothetical protein GA0115245_15012 [Streptomyces sp. di188]
MVTPCDVVPFGNVLGSVHRSVQLVPRFGRPRASVVKGSPAHVSSPFRDPAARTGIRPVPRDSRLERQPHVPSPAAFRPPASASWASCPAGGIPPLLRSAYRAHRPGPRRGFHVPRTRDTAGVGAPYTPGPAVFPRPVDRPRPPLAASSSGQALAPWSSSRHPRLGLTRHHRGFTCVRPSGLPLARLLPRTERGPLGFFPGLRTLTSGTCERTPGRGLISNTDQELRIRSITGLQSASSLEMRDFVSHQSTPTARPISRWGTAFSPCPASQHEHAHYVARAAISTTIERSRTREDRT